MEEAYVASVVIIALLSISLLTGSWKDDSTGDANFLIFLLLLAATAFHSMVLSGLSSPPYDPQHQKVKDELEFRKARILFRKLTPEQRAYRLHKKGEIGKFTEVIVKTECDDVESEVK